MKTIKIRYSSGRVKVHVGPGLFKRLASFAPEGKIFVITDANVARAYGGEMKKILHRATTHVLPAGERHKTLAAAEAIINRLLELGFSKTDSVLGFGGGTITDLSAFVSSLYKRGCNYVAVPTTLLSQADSALGGKCAVNTGPYKNQIGTYYHPDLVIVDPDLLSTLPRSEMSAGMAEIIKYGLVFDRKLFRALFSAFSLPDVIYRSLKIKAAITAADEFDKNKRLLLNYGHTVGHAVESISGFKVGHGRAVAFGMYRETKDPGTRSALAELYRRFGIDINLPYSMEKIKEYILHDKKIASGVIRVPVLRSIGKAKIVSLDVGEYIGGLL